MQNKMEIYSQNCTICGIRKRTDNNFQPKYGKALTAAETQNLICKFAKTAGCINTKSCTKEELTSADTWEKRASIINYD